MGLADPVRPGLPARPQPPHHPQRPKVRQHFHQRLRCAAGAAGAARRTLREWGHVAADGCWWWAGFSRHLPAAAKPGRCCCLLPHAHLPHPSCTALTPLPLPLAACLQTAPSRSATWAWPPCCAAALRRRACWAPPSSWPPSCMRRSMTTGWMSTGAGMCMLARVGGWVCMHARFCDAGCCDAGWGSWDGWPVAAMCCCYWQ